ncbi:Vitellogenin receptor [Araneus ventricosus]|uniref:Vitellogenin receptor n=1 Tax=Araneus ventricosus TaxID=182803 RepID=A0A4Y2NY82_ARAVE|nr:Vitellogenin receptor [Araneus ventricosus]
MKGLFRLIRWHVLAWTLNRNSEREIEEVNLSLLLLRAVTVTMESRIVRLEVILISFLAGAFLHYAEAACSVMKFKCINGRCLSFKAFCNEKDDCGDSSDEIYCDVGPATPCPFGWYRCPVMRRCIPSYWMCDGYQDCNGTSEELNCATCSPSAFRCTNGKCGPRGYFCDKKNNCGDNSDESFCVLNNRKCGGKQISLAEFSPPATKKLLSSPRLKPLDHTLTSTWDLEQLSIRPESTSFIETSKSLRNDVSPATIYQARAIKRSKMPKKIEETIFANPPHLVLHWNSKMLPSVAHGSVKSLEDRVAVLVTVKDFEHFFGVPVALKCTGEQMAEVVIQEVVRFGLRDNIIGLSASNTGLIQGACTRIEREFGRTLLWLACRHHTHEP